MDSEVVTELLVGLAIVVGIVGVVVPVLPGSLLVWAAIAVWALQAGTGTGWILLGVVTAVLALAAVVKYLVPHRRLRAAGVPQSSLLVGAALGIVGFFGLPVVGLPVGFVGGVYAAERRRQPTGRDAWHSTKAAMRAVGLAVLIELVGVLLASAGWLAVAVTS